MKSSHSRRQKLSWERKMNIKILKLRSGEEIACQVLEENDNTIKVFQPMLLKTTASFDFRGRLVDVTTLHDWLLNTDNKNIDIPTNHIAFITEPSKNALNLYAEESKKEFNKNNTEEKISESESLSPDYIANMLDELINSSNTLLDDMFETPPRSKSKKRKKNKKSSIPPDMMDEKEMDQHMIMMQLYIPAESIMNLITAGVIDPEVLLKMIEEVKKRNRFTGDEKNKKNFGNEFSDWNPDPKSKDYQ